MYNLKIKKFRVKDENIKNYDLFKVDYIPNFVNKNESNEVFAFINDIFINEKFSNTSRRSITFGDENLVYKIQFKNGTVSRPTKEWNNHIVNLKINLELFLFEKYGISIKFNICVAQRYPSGKVGIQPHKDKEMNSGIERTLIAGISLGETRILDMGPSQDPVLSLPLNNGSLYLFLPPTNDYYTHSIRKDETLDPRISLTFRKI
jgi:hypothetical protein